MAAARTTDGRFQPAPAKPDDLTPEKTGSQEGHAEGSNGNGSSPSGNGRIPSPLGENAFHFGAYCGMPGGSPNNSMAFPGWGRDRFYTGNYVTYRWMMQMPVTRIADAIATAIIEASTWEFEKVPKAGRPDIDDAALDLVTENFTRLRSRLIRDFYIEGRKMSWAPGEVLWENDEGRLIIEDVKPLVQDITELLANKNGRIVGGVNYSSPEDGKNEVRLQFPFKFFYYAHLPTAGNPYGESWLEGCRATAWKDWLSCAQQLDRLANKITGVVTVITSPAGTFPSAEPGKTVSYQKNAEAVIKALAQGAAGVWMPALSITPDSRGSVDAMRLMAELSGKSLTNIQILDFGKQAAAISPILERMKHDEELIFNAGLRSARTGLEASHGTKAEAGVHTDTGTVIAETDDERFATWCQPLVDALLVANYGDRAKGRVRIKPPSLVDRKSEMLRAILLSLGNTPEVSREQAATIDQNRIFAVLDIPTVPGKKYDADAVRKDVEAGRKPPTPAPGKKTPEPEGGRPRGTKEKKRPTRRNKPKP